MLKKIMVMFEHVSLNVVVFTKNEWINSRNNLERHDFYWTFDFEKGIFICFFLHVKLSVNVQ
jgi:hypothetical protein